MVDQLKNTSEVHPIYCLRYAVPKLSKTVCDRCGGIQKSVDCSHPTTDVSIRKYSNCGKKHTANYCGYDAVLRLKLKTILRSGKQAQYYA